MHILVVNDDGPPSPKSSPYIHSFVLALQRAGHAVSVALPHTQRSWISKAHIIGQTVKPTYYCPGVLKKDNGTTHTRPLTPSPQTQDQEEKWILLDGTPASCVQIGLYHCFEYKGPIDLVIAGPNCGRNVTAVYNLSSGTLGGAMEAAICRKKSIALSYAYFHHEKHDYDIIEEANILAVRIVEYLVEHWSDGTGADLYNVNIPLVKGMSGNKVLWTKILDNKWEAQSCFQDTWDEEDAADTRKEEQMIRERENEPLEGVKGSKEVTRHTHKNFRWAPRSRDVYKSVDDSGPGSDGWAVQEGNTSVTPLKANFMHGIVQDGELKLAAFPPVKLHANAAKMSPIEKKMAVHTIFKHHVYVYIDYEDVYVQPLILSALTSSYPTESLTFIPSPSHLPSSSTRYLHIGAYESIPFEQILMHPTTSLANSYVIRKALIRKHYLSNTVYSWIAKHPSSILATNVKPSCSFELDYAEYLDDALVEAWELKESFKSNEGKSAAEREWWILKPSMSDRGEGIRIFSTEEELQTIFEQWEADRPDSEDEEGNEDDSRDSNTEGGSRTIDTTPSNDYIVTSDLRHFIAQPYIDKPLLLNDMCKFHIRAYVLAIGALEVFVYKPMLALFAGAPYVPPWESPSDSPSGFDLSPHLTNTCVQASLPTTSSPRSSSRPKVRLLSSLSLPPSRSLDDINTQIYHLTGEIFEAAARTQSIHFQPLPNAFEVFGLDFLVDEQGKVWLLECNAFPDFEQTGEDLRSVVEGFWNSTIRRVMSWWQEDAKGGVGALDLTARDSADDDDEELVLVRSMDLGRR